MTTALDPQTAKRLAFLRLVYEQGVQQSRLPEPLNATALLFLHDSVELFLVLAGDHLRAQLDRKTNFLDYWDRLKKAPNGVHLSGVAGMRRLNHHRNELKHVGNMPSPGILDQVRSDVATFFDDNVPRVFGGLSFDSIDLSDVIPQQEVRDLVKRATERAGAGKRSLAMISLTRAFHALFRGRGINGFGTTLKPDPWMSGNLESVLSQQNDRGRGRQVGRKLGILYESVTEMQSAMRVIALGLDLHEYRRFEQLLPRVWSMDEATDEKIAQGDEKRGWVANHEEFEFCRQFIIQAALRDAEIEAHQQRPSWLRR
ncbi:hypothetical protein [Streptomyces sp. NPDC007074]|uniref:hypothetical protein n=1 Tax=Streptomyces sp. NPDC007074 TaxID=3156764 RepID=UPI0033D1C939